MQSRDIGYVWNPRICAVPEGVMQGHHGWSQVSKKGKPRPVPQGLILDGAFHDLKCKGAKPFSDSVLVYC